MEKKSKNKSENGNYGHGFSDGRDKHGGGGGDVGTSNESEWSINQNKKRQIRLTGGTFDVHDTTLSKNDFKQLSTDDKFVTLFEMLTFANSMNARVQNIEANVNLYHMTILKQTSEYKSLNIVVFMLKPEVEETI
ncbi:hypothetical protein DPMN_171295 [Dreissena polymorpha]|uniref:Uncharacterized protein n=1 Tax=Dreissena polymorpha TaxID=45954 RepID=A0A9D4ICA4_DREPO|nr:hypothetical protein DPMN_171295 [Dreissena polymorpha]